MSPARSHAEQTRNTLLFASCAKEVETNAQVNVVVSDKALVKQLQKQLAKLESELRYSGSSRPNNSDSSELLREKDQEIEMVIIKLLIQTLFICIFYFIVNTNSLYAVKERGKGADIAA
jgi:metal-dependent amidase/aminoacylase/carboxypeptidase family protein